MPTCVRVPVLLMAGVMLTVLPGCSAGRAAVSGKVPFKGKPLARGTVYVGSPDGVQWPASISAEGTYRIESMPAGKALIAVNSIKPAMPVTPPARASKRDPAAAPPAPPPELAKWIEIPERYADTRTS